MRKNNTANRVARAFDISPQSLGIVENTLSVADGECALVMDWDAWMRSNPSFIEIVCKSKVYWSRGCAPNSD